MFGNNSIPGIKTATGSLGHGVGIGTGIAFSAKKYNNNRPLHVFNAFINDKAELEDSGDLDNFNSRRFADEHEMIFHQVIIDKEYYLNNIVDIVRMHDELFLDSGMMVYYAILLYSF